jgi:ATP-dependent exoDNAse (exonuclease V) beta subunit
VALDNLKIISAGAGSGKTFRLMQEMVRLIKGGLKAQGIIATTFTQKAAAELQERVSTELIREGLFDQAAELPNALIGTVHSLGVKLLQRFAYEAGVSPSIQIMPDADQQLIFNQSLATVLQAERVERIDKLCEKLGFNQPNLNFDWRKEVKTIIDYARSNDFSTTVLEESKQRSFDTLAAFLPPADPHFGSQAASELKSLIQTTLEALEANEDDTQKTQTAQKIIQDAATKLAYTDDIPWYYWIKLARLEPGKKSKEAMEALAGFADRHETHPQFHQDIRDYIFAIFEVAIDAILEYEQYKRKRGLIDYTDMEVKVRQLLGIPSVKQVLAQEIELLMVDEFQDTSPIQLEIFLSLSTIARHSIWVGDPKQSIYGFRGADPKLMQAIIDATGGIKAENIQPFSWRSREDLVFLSNALFCKVFSGIPEEQVALQPKRTKIAKPDSPRPSGEPIDLDLAVQHWHFQHEGTKKIPPGKPWMENSIATILRTKLKEGIYLPDSSGKGTRLATPADVAILCRSNAECLEIEKALSRVGVKAVIAGKGLLDTAEAKLVLACLKYLLSPKDELSVAEILFLGTPQSLESIVEDRLAFLQDTPKESWGSQYPIIRELQHLSAGLQELSCSETLHLVIERLRLEHLALQWGNKSKRLANMDELRRLATVYEDNCFNSHSPATLGGFLLWLYDLNQAEKDDQGTDQDPDAVKILTYHKSKGLEWPITICHSLENNLKNSFTDVKIMSTQTEVDLNNILGNRWLRFWINPYGSPQLKSPLRERLESSDFCVQDTRDALLEEARLLYVGLTRARDILIFPTRNAPTRWLNRVFHQGNESQPVLDPYTDDTPWVWEQQVIAKETLVQTMPNDFVREPAAPETITHLQQPAGLSPSNPRFIDLKRENWDKQLVVQIQPAHAYLATPPDEEFMLSSQNLSAAIKAFLRADHRQYAPAHRQKIAEGIATRFEAGTAPGAQQLIRWNGQWLDFLHNRYPDYLHQRNLPLRAVFDERVFMTTLDDLLLNDREIIVLQQSSFAGEPEKMEQKSRNLAPWMHFARLGLKQLYPDLPVRTFVHYFAKGRIQEIVTSLNHPAVSGKN